MSIINIPYSTSNRFISYPLENNTEATGLPLDFLLEAHFILDKPGSVYLRSMGLGSMRLTIDLDGEDPTDVYIPITANTWCNTLGRYFVLCSTADITLSVTQLKFSSDTLFIQPDSVKDIEFDYTDDEEAEHTAVISGVVSIEAGYNISTVVSDNEITIDSIPGAGKGKAPCDILPLPEGLRSFNGIPGDDNADFKLHGDPCIHIMPGFNTIILNNRCVACCECEDYWDIFNHIHDINWYIPTFITDGFPVSVAGEYTPLSTIEWANTALDLKLQKHRVVIDGSTNTYVWEISTIDTFEVMYTSSVIKTDPLEGIIPIGCLWYEGEYTDVESITNDIFTYKEKDAQHPWYTYRFVAKRAQDLYSGIQTLYYGIHTVYNSNREAYQNAVYYWNSVDRSTPISIQGWLSPGSVITGEGFSTGGSNNAVLGLKLYLGTEPVDTYSTWFKVTDNSANDDEIISRKEVWYDGVNRYDNFSGPSARYSKLAYSSVLQRPDRDTEDWDINIGCTIVRPGDDTYGISWEGDLLYCTEASGSPDTPTVDIKFESSTTSRVLTFSGSNTSGIWTIAYETSGSQSYAYPFVSSLGGVAYYDIPAPWDVYWGVTYDIAPIKTINIKAGIAQS